MRVVFGGLAGFRLLGVAVRAVLSRTSDIDRIHAGIAATHGNVEHMTADDFSALGSDEVVLFDVREPDEFAVSHLPDAVLVDPGMSVSEFAARFSDRLSGKRVIFYCSVGVRSSILAERVAKLVEALSGKTPVNLIGGIFRWRNEGLRLVTISGNSASAVHPYDDYWGRLVEDREAVSYLPRE